MPALSRIFLILVGSFGAGIFGALLGLGGGVLLVPMLTLLFGFDFHVAVGASIVGVIATSSGAASAFVYYARGDILPLIAGPTALGVYIGALFGTRIGERFRNRWLEWLFAVVLALVVISMLSSGLHLSLGR